MADITAQKGLELHGHERRMGNPRILEAILPPGKRRTSWFDAKC